MLIGVGAAAAALRAPTDSAFSVPGTEAQRAIDLLAKKSPGTGGASARVVVAAPAGHTLDEARYRNLLTPTLTLVRRVPQTARGTGETKTPLMCSAPVPASSPPPRRS
jgi:RND superfamily putative drug exporter